MLHNIKHLWGVGQPKIWLSDFCFSTDIDTLKVTQDELDEFVRICEVSGIPVAEQCAMFKRVLWQIKNYGDNGFGDRDPGQGSRIIYWFQHLPLSTAPAGTATVEGTASGTGEPPASEVDGSVLTTPPPPPTTQQSQTSGPQPPSIQSPPTAQTSEPQPPSHQPPPSTVPAAVQGLVAGADADATTSTAFRTLHIRSSFCEKFDVEVPSDMPFRDVKKLPQFIENVEFPVRQEIKLHPELKRHFSEAILVSALPDMTIDIIKQTGRKPKQQVVGEAQQDPGTLAMHVDLPPLAQHLLDASAEHTEQGDFLANQNEVIASTCFSTGDLALLGNTF